MTADVAVIIPAYNAEGFLDSTLASVAGQSVPAAEVVVGDDCSTDSTIEVARAWKGRLPITVVSTGVNGGPAAGRNRAIEASSSAILANLDADDAWLPDHLETLLAQHEANRIVTPDALMWAPGIGVGVRWTDAHPVPSYNQLTHLYRTNFVHSGSMYTREGWEQAGRYREQYRGPEDWDLWIRMVRQGAVVTPAGHPTVLYRVGPNSVTSTARMADDRVAMLEHAATEAKTDDERRAARRGVRLVRAERDLGRAYRAARAGQPWAARRSALKALGGHQRVQVRGAAMLLAPRWVAGRQGEARAEPGARLGGDGK